MIKKIFTSDPWHIRYQEYDPKDLAWISSIFALSNGILGIRGDFEEAVNTKSKRQYYQDLFGATQDQQRLINLPDFTAMRLVADNIPVQISSENISEFQLDLDLHNAVVTRSFIWEQAANRLKIKYQHFLSQAEPNIAAFSLSVKALEGNPVILIIPAIEAQKPEQRLMPGYQVINTQNLENLSTMTLTSTGDNPQTALTMAMWSSAYGPKFDVQNQANSQGIRHHYVGQLKTGENLTLEKVVRLQLSPIQQLETINRQNQSVLNKITSMGIDGIKSRQEKYWSEFWHENDLTIETSDGDTELQQGMRYNLLHLAMNQPRAGHWSSVGLTHQLHSGEIHWQDFNTAMAAYLGLLPSSTAHGLLHQLVDHLTIAEQKSASLGTKGVLYPVCSSGGQEVPQAFPINAESIYINALITHSIYDYLNHTNDWSFIQAAGAKILRDIARFFSSRADYLPEQDQFTFLSVTGPNHYELNVDHNWFTNSMVQWSLNFILNILNRLDDKLRVALGIRVTEKRRWQLIRDNMFFVKAPKSKVIPQSESYLNKLLPSVTTVLPNQDISRDRYLRLPYVAQPEVMLGLLLLEDHFSEAEQTQNYAYYEPLTLHKSQDSKNICAITAATIGKHSDALLYFEAGARVDLDQVFADTSGLHLTAMSSSWLALVEGMAGLRIKNGQLSLAPFCPESWERYSFHFHFQKRLLQVTVTSQVTEVRLLQGYPLTIVLDGQALILE